MGRMPAIKSETTHGITFQMLIVGEEPQQLVLRCERGELYASIVTPRQLAN